MKRKGLVVGLAVCALLLAGVLAGCGSSGTLDNYKKDMKAWVDKYEAELTQRVAVLETITDPLAATDEQIKGAQDFVDLASAAASALEDIKPPEDLASAHQTYVDGAKTMTQGVQQFVQAMKDKSSSELSAAMKAMSAGDQIQQAETTLEQALGFKLTSD